MFIVFSSQNWVTFCNINLSLWGKTTVTETYKKKINLICAICGLYICWWRRLIIKSPNNTSSFQDLVVYIRGWWLLKRLQFLNVLFHEWSSCFYKRPDNMISGGSAALRRDQSYIFNQNQVFMLCLINLCIVVYRPILKIWTCCLYLWVI